MAHLCLPVAGRARGHALPGNVFMKRFRFPNIRIGKHIQRQ
ncbi:hypothetical protein C7S15_8514 [Burkholderia cepacia]|nr:hypothetical protein [Burkholderia cepacia]